MASTFFGLHIGYSGLNAFQASINTTANNISNVQTEGYTRQTVDLSPSSAMRVYQKYGSTGTGRWNTVHARFGRHFLRSSIRRCVGSGSSSAA